MKPAAVVEEKRFTDIFLWEGLLHDLVNFCNFAPQSRVEQIFHVVVRASLQVCSNECPLVSEFVELLEDYFLLFGVDGSELDGGVEVITVPSICVIYILFPYLSRHYLWLRPSMPYRFRNSCATSNQWDSPISLTSSTRAFYSCGGEVICAANLRIPSMACVLCPLVLFLSCLRCFRFRALLE